MLELTTLVWVCVGVFTVIGWSRSWTKEIIALAGITLGLFALHQFDIALREQLLALLPAQGKFLVQTGILLLIAFFAYQTRALVGGGAPPRDDEGGRDPLQARVLGGFVGAINGYLVSGSVWYFMHINEYPLSPFIEAPAEGSLSLSTVNNLPLYVLASGPGSQGDLLTLLVIVLFVVVLILI